MLPKGRIQKFISFVSFIVVPVCGLYSQQEATEEELRIYNQFLEAQIDVCEIEFGIESSVRVIDCEDLDGNYHVYREGGAYLGNLTCSGDICDVSFGFNQRRWRGRLRVEFFEPSYTGIVSLQRECVFSGGNPSAYLNNHMRIYMCQNYYVRNRPENLVRVTYNSIGLVKYIVDAESNTFLIFVDNDLDEFLRLIRSYSTRQTPYVLVKVYHNYMSGERVGVCELDQR